MVYWLGNEGPTAQSFIVFAYLLALCRWGEDVFDRDLHAGLDFDVGTVRDAQRGTAYLPCVANLSALPIQ